ncbi:MAG: hypothetical protein CML29_14885 [Rhizobiales bacterium]|nr:hypothetical protein [Hyphomicrobiales bacterium]MBA69894.1 hypothetical protein [Hyphomicrobiales bacterium]|tara:strand:- start:332 stop:544 length:213 start_codon:yes stop_codon:yes gene_type:complete
MAPRFADTPGFRFQAPLLRDVALLGDARLIQVSTGFQRKFATRTESDHNMSGSGSRLGAFNRAGQIGPMP